MGGGNVDVLPPEDRLSDVQRRLGFAQKERAFIKYR